MAIEKDIDLIVAVKTSSLHWSFFFLFFSENEVDGENNSVASQRTWSHIYFMALLKTGQV